MTWTFLWAAALAVGGAPPVQALRTERVGEVTYFEVAFGPVPGMRVPWLTPAGAWYQGAGRNLARVPCLVSQDGKAGHVYYFPSGNVYLGKLRGEGKAEFQLRYPAGEAPPLKDDATPTERIARALNNGTWDEETVVLDFAGARPGKDLEKRWAGAQAAQFAVLEAQSNDFGFYAFAREATGRRYGVTSASLKERPAREVELATRRSYELTTGAAAITESLQLHRMLSPDPQSRAQRTVDVRGVKGIDIAEHPWEKMMAGQKPSPEPLAKLIPHDNYYLHFKNLRQFIEFGELLDDWGTNLTRAYEANSRDYRLKERYEKQLCLKSTWLGKTFGPAVTRGMAITGSDAYLREGSDVTVLFHVTNKALLLGALNGFLDEARREHGARLKESQEEYQGVKIESFVTPLREVSLHRAVLDEYILYSNSRAGLRRVLDTRQGKHKALADSLDFQYMRTVFRLEDQQEDGFLFLSDAFIRQLVGPVSKIKEKRRLEALTSLSLVTNAALFHAWETGKLPADHKAALAASHLRAEEVYDPEGKRLAWDPAAQAAASDSYNTLRFATPLIELPLDLITKQEESEYNTFRLQYLGLWRRYFDPVGVRVQVRPERVRLETYILPLIASSEYNSMRSFVGSGVTTLDTARFSPRTVLQWVSSLPTPNLNNNALGEWITIRLDDGPGLVNLVEFLIRRELDPSTDLDRFREEARHVFQLPLTAGVKIGNEKEFDALLVQVEPFLKEFGQHTKKVLPPYKGVAITHIQFGPASRLAQEFYGNKIPRERRVMPQLFHAKIDGAWYVSLSDAPLKDLIDRREVPAGEATAVNAALHLNPGAGKEVQAALELYLQWINHRGAVGNTPLWYALYRTGQVPAKATEKEMAEAALRLYGYVPASPDGTAYFYNPKTDEVENGWHGTLRRPRLRPQLEATSYVNQLLRQFKTVRADLRFKEDGINTVLTIDRR